MKKLFPFLILVSMLELTCCSQETNVQKTSDDTLSVAPTEDKSVNTYSKGCVFPTDSIPDYLLRKDTLFVFTGDFAYQDPFYGIKTREDFKRIYKDYQETKKPDSMYQYKSNNNSITLGYVTEDQMEAGDSVYTYCLDAEIKDATIGLNVIGRIGRAKSDFFTPFKLGVKEEGKVNVMCIVTLLEAYYYILSFENESLKSVKIKNISSIDEGYHHRLCDELSAKY